MFKVEDLVYNLYGIEENIINMLRLCYNYLPTYTESTLDIKKAYTNFITNHTYLSEIPTIQNEITIINDIVLEIQIAQLFIDEPQYLFPIANIKEKTDQIKKMYDVLGELKCIRKDLYKLLDLFIHSIIIMDANQGYSGASAAALGTIWINNKSYFTQQDVIEMLIHEFTHNLFFVDEIVNTHYLFHDLFFDEENFIVTSLGVKKPIKDVMHRIIVSVELLLSRENFLSHDSLNITYHSQTPILLQQVKDLIFSVYNIRDYDLILSDRAKDILIRCSNVVQQM